MTIRRTALLFVLALSLAACQTTENSTPATRSAQIGSALEKAADQASAQGQTQESLALLERMYKRDSGNPETALKYATALEGAGRLHRAAMVLSPFVENQAKSAPAALIKYSSILAAMGSYEDAERYARSAIATTPDSGEAHQVLGIALDAQGRHPEAETEFRKALELWPGDPVPVMNNLGLNLASQGYLDEAVEMLRQAAALAPGRAEIERNLRIVSTLQTQPHKKRSVEGEAAAAPKPPRKPGA